MVIADDGTPDFDEKRVREWFDKNNFKAYQIVHNEQNKGTVYNVLSGVQAAKGKYVKFISPGDYFYNEKVLCNMYEVMERNSAYVGFGKSVAYSVDNNNLTNILPFRAPKVLDPYRENSLKEIQYNYLYFRDYILGAALIYEREILLKYLNKIKGKVIYAEDCVVIWMVADGMIPALLDEYVVWYEYGTGISTQSSKVWEERLTNDNRNCFELIVEGHPEYRDAYNIFIKRKSIKTIILKIKRRLYFRKNALDQYPCEEKNIDNSFLQKIIMMK